jgi:hypothetical protein
LSATITNLSYRKVSVNNYIYILEADIPNTFVGNLYEYGISKKLPGNSNLGVEENRMIFFDSSEAWSAGEFSGDDSRINGEGLLLSPTAGNTITATLSASGYDLDAFSIAVDVFKLAYHSQNIASARIRFVTGGGNLDFDITPSGGYEVESQLMSGILASSSDLEGLTQIEVSATAGALDGTMLFDEFMSTAVSSERVSETLLVRGILSAPFELNRPGDSGIQIAIPYNFT